MPQDRKGNNGGRGQGQGPATTNGGQGAMVQGGGGATAQGGGGAADLRARAGEVSEVARERYDQARELVAHKYRRTEGMIARNPGTSVLLGFGLGVGAGLLLTALFAREEETWYDRYVPERLRDVPERLGKLKIKEHAYDLSSRLRDLPEQVLDRIRS
jgi:ElaB/YqjD/DUF883 family membrane-anchored ribosome-binding protein